ncbi:MAG: DUF3310 domain-containing protein, partial [Planctomycetota bacterium]
MLMFWLQFNPENLTLNIEIARLICSTSTEQTKGGQKMNLDMSEKAAHYRVYPIEQVDIIAGNGLSYFQGCALKYITRWRHKVAPMQDLDK